MTNTPEHGTFAHRQLSWVTVRVDVYVSHPMVSGWFAAYKAPQTSEPTNDVKIGKACRVYQSWTKSLKRQSPRAVHVNAKGVRLIVDNLIVAGFGCLPHDEWLQNGTRGKLQSLTEKGTRNATTRKQRARDASRKTGRESAPVGRD